MAKVIFESADLVADALASALTHPSHAGRGVPCTQNRNRYREARSGIDFPAPDGLAPPERKFNPQFLRGSREDAKDAKMMLGALGDVARESDRI